MDPTYWQSTAEVGVSNLVTRRACSWQVHDHAGKGSLRNPDTKILHCRAAHERRGLPCCRSGDHALWGTSLVEQFGDPACGKFLMTFLHPRACHVLITPIPAWGRKIQGPPCYTYSVVRPRRLLYRLDTSFTEATAALRSVQGSGGRNKSRLRSRRRCIFVTSSTTTQCPAKIV
jgi:hypothetical protein